MERSLARYLRHHKAVGNSARTAWYHQTTIDLFIRWAKAKGYSTDIQDLEVDMVREWVEEQRDKELSPATIRSRVKSLKAFTAWLVEEEWISKDPLAKLRVPKVGDIQKPTFTPAEVDKLLAACNRDTITGLRDYAIILTLYSTGLRASELVALEVTDIDYEQGLISVRRGKGGKFRVVPLGMKADKAISRYLAKRGDPKRGPLFASDEEEPLKYNGLKELLRRRGNKANVHANPHKFRHSFAVAFLRNGGKLEALKTIMGHTDFEITLHYGRLAGVDVTTAHEQADPAKGLKSK